MTTKNLIFEIGTEEIPSAALYKATEQLKSLATDAFNTAILEYGEISTCSTPRRMILSVKDLADATQAQTIRSKGPNVAIAFDEEGNPTKAAQGFARGKGVEVDALVRETDTDGKEYLWAVVDKPAVSANDLLPDILSGLIPALSWPKSQRWGSRQETFSRPVRWLVALFGEDIVDVEFAGLKAGRTTRGHRLIADREFEIASADTFFDMFEEMWVIPSAEERARIIREEIAAVEKETGLKADLPQGTFDEVVNLVEYPTVLVAHFDERFLDVPPEIITDAMLEHQRYFPMYRADGSLDNAFIVTGNGNPKNSEVITSGNERVVRARLDDAAFFVAEDQRKPLESYVEGLEQVVFQEKLGTVGAKTKRIQKNAAFVCQEAGITGQDEADCARTALLCKADLITNAVVEFTSLQGVMGGHYAIASGETEAVACGITDHYRPRFAGDELPRNLCGKIVALCDKMDTVCGIFAIDQGPTGSSDPFALRRAAIGIIHLLLDGLNVSLTQLIKFALGNYKDVVEFDFDKVCTQVIDFFSTRLEVIAKDKGFEPDVIQAVMSTGMIEPVETIARVSALTNARNDQLELFDDLATAYTRANNLREPEAGVDYDHDALNEVQNALSCAIVEAERKVGIALDNNDYAEALENLASLRAPIDLFFDKVMVKDEDLKVREANMQLLNRFVAVFANVANIGKLSR